MDASLALGFLKTLLPVEVDASLNLTGKVTIEMVNALGRRMKIPTIQQFLSRKESLVFRRAVSEFMQKNGENARAFLAYETWRTNKLKITAEGGKTISPGLKVGEISPLSKVEGKFTYKKKSESEIEISGDKFYVFAIRVGQLVRGNAVDTVKFQPTGFLKPAEWGVKAAGTDIDFSASILDHFEVVKLGETGSR